MRCASWTGRRVRCARCAASSTWRSRVCAMSCAASRRRKRLPRELNMTPAAYGRSLEQLRTLELGAVRPLDDGSAEGAGLLDLCFDPDEGPEVRLQRDRDARAPGARHRAAAAPRAPHSGAVLPAGDDARRDRRGHRRRRIACVAASLAGDLRACAPRCARPSAWQRRRRRWPRFSLRTRSTRCSVRAARPTARRPAKRQRHCGLATTSAGRTAPPANRSARCISCTTASPAIWARRCPRICGRSPRSGSSRWSSSRTPSS